MERTYPGFIALVFMLLGVHLAAQKPGQPFKDVDPRRYIEVYETPYSLANNDNKHIELWKYLNPSQTAGVESKDDYFFHKYVDRRSSLEIRFNIDSLIKDIHVFGNFYITASLNERPIEVGAYSEVGKDLRELRLFSKAPKDIARALVSFILMTGYTMDGEYEELRNSIKNHISSKGDGLIKEPDNTIIFRQLEAFISELEHSLAYVSLISESGYYSKKAFLSLLGPYDTSFNFYTNMIKEFVKDFKGKKEIDPRPFQEELKEVKKNTESIIYIRGGGLEAILTSLGYRSNFYKIATAEDSISEYRKDKNLTGTIFSNKDDVEKLYKDMAEAAARVLYRTLITGTIDLRESDAKEGDVLKISLMWYNLQGNEKDTSGAKPPYSLKTISFNIVDAGWKIKPSDSALLINRINEDLARPDNLSSSRFKPTGGISLLFTYQNDYRYYKKGSYKISGFKKVCKWLEPSFGLNVSYIDFVKDDNMEIGVGPVIGLFRNRVFVNGGYSLSTNKEQPFYFGLGFSFSNLITQSAKNKNNANN